ncbi:MAG: hypothetical protein WCA35_03265 [Kovacikia sp.]
MTIQASDNIYPLYKRDTPEQWTVTNGMTKREHFAVIAMQGLIAHYGYKEAPAASAEEIAQWAVTLADALIGELNQ